MAENKDIELLKGREVVKRLGGLGYSTLLEMASRGHVPSYRVGRRGRRFVFSEVVEALRRLASAA